MSKSNKTGPPDDTTRALFERKVGPYKTGDVVIHDAGRNVGVIGTDGLIHTANMSFTADRPRWLFVGNLKSAASAAASSPAMQAIVDLLAAGTDPAGQTAPTLRRRLGSLRAAKRRAFGCCSGDRGTSGNPLGCWCDLWPPGEGP